MLRVRPIHYTSNMPQWRSLLLALGLTTTDGPDAGWQLFDSRNGKVALHTADANNQGVTQLGFEVRDEKIFVERTRESGTAAALTQENHGPSARITAPNGFGFNAEPSTDLRLADPANPLSVMQLWYSEDGQVQEKVLADIGARLTLSSHTPEGKLTWALFQAKNGGLTAVHLGRQDGVELSFEYDGDLAALARKLTSAGVGSEIVDENYGRTLLLENPDNESAKIWINQKQQDFHGYTAHNQ